MSPMLQQDLSIHSLDIPENIRRLLERMGIVSLYPSQAQCVTSLFAGDNLVLAVPTASGKTLVAYMGILNKVMGAGGKALYIVPLRSLAFEKYEELKELVQGTGLRVGLTVGDYTAQDDLARNYDILVATSEKVDSLFRNRSLYYGEIACFVADEVHLLDDPGRGATLEVILTKIMLKNSGAQIIALSATIPNAREIADWLRAELVYSNWRPVELKKGALSGREILFEDGSTKELEDHLEEYRARAPRRRNPRTGEEIVNVTLDTIRNQKQILVFQNTRKSTVSFALQLGGYVKDRLSQEEKNQLEALARELEDSQTDPVPLIEELAKTLRSGAAYHHAGLTNSQRKLIETGFSQGLIKALCATPTLAAGVNLPAQRVVVKNIYRYGQLGMEPISPLELQQMLGRAGRPRYDSYGEAMILVPKKDTPESIVKGILQTPPADIVSKLFLESNLRMHILGFIAEGEARSRKELEHVLSKTFLAHQGGVYQDNLDKVLHFLDSHDLVDCGWEKDPLEEKGDARDPEDPEEFFGFQTAASLKKKQEEDFSILPTEFGHRTARLYIDPYTAVEFKRALEYLEKKQKDVPEIAGSEILFLQTVCRSSEMLKLFLRKADFQDLMVLSQERRDELLITDRLDMEKRTHSGSRDMEWFFSELKTALLLEDWVQEKAERHITSRFNIGPGDIRNKVELSTWLLGGLYEISKMKDVGLDLPTLKGLVLRMEFGIKKELLPLVKIKGIGRVRARVLHNAGYTTVGRLKRASESDLAKLSKLGPGIARAVKEQVEKG